MPVRKARLIVIGRNHGIIVTEKEDIKMSELLVTVIHECAHYGGSILEACGIITLLYYAAKTIVEMIQRKKGAEFNLSKGISLALEFLLAGEVLHTIIAENTNDLIMLGALVVLRAIMTLEIHFELKAHEHERFDKATNQEK